MRAGPGGLLDQVEGVVDLIEEATRTGAHCEAPLPDAGGPVT